MFVCQSFLELEHKEVVGCISSVSHILSKGYRSEGSSVFEMSWINNFMELLG